MSITLSAISSLVSIGKAIMETIKTARDAFKISSSQNVKAPETQLDELSTNFSIYQQRIELLSKRLLQSESLRRYVQVWLYHSEKFGYIPQAATEDDFKKLHSDLYTFISQSKYDYFSNAFYRTTYDKVTELHETINSFRRRIDRISEDISRVTPGKIEGMKYLWENTIQGELNSVRRDAQELEKLATNIYEEIINELQQASSNN